MADHFYVTLPSNSSTAVYGRQPSHNYKTKLARPIRLDPAQWEVGLAELSYPKSVIHLKTDSVIDVYLPDRDSGPVSATVLQGNYEDPEELVSLVAQAVRAAVGHERSHWIGFDYLDDKRCFVRLHTGCAMLLQPALARMLGWDTDHVLHLSNYQGRPSPVPAPSLRGYLNLDAQAHFSEMAVYASRELHSLYVYCDIVSYQAVGDSLAPLLRSVTVSGGRGDEVISHIFNKIHYLPLERSLYETIEIHIADDTGSDVAFMHGHVIVKLHFRRRRKY